MSLRETKAELRRQMRKLRANMGDEARAAASLAIVQRVLAHESYAQAETVALYADFRQEVQVEALLAGARRDGKRVVLPRVEDGGTLTLRLVLPEAPLVLSPLGIAEPASSSPTVAPRQVDLFVVPGLAFDTRGGRLGYGRGHYDRLLLSAQGNATLVGLAFECQVVDAVPLEVHDVRLNHVVTERRWLAGQAPGADRREDG